MGGSRPTWWDRRAALAAGLGGAVAAVALVPGLDAPVERVLVSSGALLAIGGATFTALAARSERRRDDVQAGRLLRAPIRRVSRLDPIDLGVDAADTGQTVRLGGERPDYLQRDVDATLSTVLASAIDGGGPPIVLVVGPSKVGKSRSLFEALLRYDTQTREMSVVAPTNAEAAAEILTPGSGVDLPTTNCILWLDDIEPFLDGGFVAETMLEWCSPGRVIVACYGGKGGVRIGDGSHGKVASLLDNIVAHATIVELQATSADELASVLQGLSASQLEDVKRFGLAAYLVAAPLLERKLATRQHGAAKESPEGFLLAEVLVNWSRCGRTDPIGNGIARSLWSIRVGQEGWSADDEVWQRAKAWVLEPVAGRVALATAHSTDQLSAYDLTARLMSPRRDVPPPLDQSWNAASDSAVDAQCLTVGAVAYYDGRVDVALAAFLRGQESVDILVASTCLFHAGGIYSERDGDTAAIDAYDELDRRFGTDDHPPVRERVASALVNRAVVLGRRDGDTAEIDAYDELDRRFGTDDHPPVREQVARALFNRAVVLGRRDGDTAAIDAYDELDRRFGTDDHPPVREQVARALFNEGSIRICAGQAAQADQLFSRALDAPSVWLLVTIAPVLAARRNLARARELITIAATLGFADSNVHFTAFLDDLERAETAGARLLEMADDGDSDAMNALGVLALRRGLRAKAQFWWEASQQAQDAAARVLLHLLSGAD